MVLLIETTARRPPFSKGWRNCGTTSVEFLGSADNIHVVESAQRAILLQTDATKRKAEILKEFSGGAVSLANFLLQHRKSKRLMDLHKEMYSTCKATALFNSQTICDIERCVVRSKGKAFKTIASSSTCRGTVKLSAPSASSLSNLACILNGVSPSRYERTGTSRDTPI